MYETGSCTSTCACACSVLSAVIVTGTKVLNDVARIESDVATCSLTTCGVAICDVATIVIYCAVSSIGKCFDLVSIVVCDLFCCEIAEKRKGFC